MEAKIPLLEVRDLEVVYETDEETVRAVNNISFSIHKGETMGLVGETGAGKTTTALSLLRLLPERTGRILSGSISFDGLDLLSLPPGDMRAIRGSAISMIFQDPMTSLNPVIPMGKQIAEVLELHNDERRLSTRQIDERVDHMLKLVGISPDRKNEYPHQFSGGMKQRVVIAIALCCDPKLLIADEPTTALDVTIQAQVLEMMENLKKQFQASMLLITHDLGIVAQICDSVAIMYAGEVVEMGSVYDIFESDDHHPYTRGLFGSIPKMDDQVSRLNPIPGLMPDPTDLPPACVFSPRCPRCMEVCTIEKPTIRVSGSHSIKCHLYRDVGPGGQEEENQ